MSTIDKIFSFKVVREVRTCFEKRCMISEEWGRKGQMLVEALVALSVLTVGFLGILTLLSRSIALTRVVGDNYIATYLAAEGIEIIKNLVDANYIQRKSWGDGFDISGQRYEVDYKDTNPNSLTVFSEPGNFLNFNPATNFYSYDVGAGSPSLFKRIVTVTFPNADEMQVVSEVSWITRGGGLSKVLVEDHFYNWRP